jgi:hypothetical protein
MRMAIWFVTASITCIVVAAGFVLLLPLQVIMSLVQRKPWSETEPYQSLHYALYRGWAEPGSNTRPYAEWRQDKFAPPNDDDVISDVEEHRQRKLERMAREREEQEGTS